MGSLKEINYKNFHACFLGLLNELAPIKKRYLRGNSQPFMTKTLRKAIMTRSRLRNKYNYQHTAENWHNYKKQRNFCVNLLKKAKKDHFSNIDVNKLNDNKNFWKTIKPFFTDKGINSHKLMLIENGTIITNEIDLGEVINTYFINIPDKLELKRNNHSKDNVDLSDIIETYKDHLSINKICSTFNNMQHFQLAPVSERAYKAITAWEYAFSKKGTDH